MTRTKLAVAAFLVVVVCAVFPPWTGVGQWRSDQNGKEVVADASKELDQKFFGALPWAYNWFWRPPVLTVSGRNYSVGLGGATSYVLDTKSIVPRIHIVFLVIQTSLLAIVATLATAYGGLLKAGLLLMSFVFTALVAFIGFYSNLVRIQSTIFSVSNASLLLALFGVIGVWSSLMLIGLPRAAGFICAGALISIAGIGVYSLVSQHHSVFSLFSVKWILPPILLTCAIAWLFIFERDAAHQSSPDHKPNTSS